MNKKNYKKISLAQGSGGLDSAELIKTFREILNFTGKWKNCGDDAAVFELPSGEKLVFTTDGYIVDPIFFRGGDIGKIAVSGTINDISVMGARPIGLSLSIVIEEGFSNESLMKIMTSISQVAKSAGVPVVTGDTKVTEKGKIDKIQITTAGVGIAKYIIENNGIKDGDSIITSGNLGDHSIVLLSERLGYKTTLKTDSKPLNKELLAVGKYLNACKDPTRGGLAANLIEMSEKSSVQVVLLEKDLPFKKEVFAAADIFGLDVMSLASEGRFVASVSQKNLQKVLSILKKYNKDAAVIGQAKKVIKKDEIGLFLNTSIGSIKKIYMPSGKLIPRIC